MEFFSFQIFIVCYYLFLIVIHFTYSFISGLGGLIGVPNTVLTKNLIERFSRY